jgi:hypothetical protein
MNLTRRTFLGSMLAALALSVGVKTGGITPAAAPKQIWRDRYNDPPDQTLHAQIFS